MKLLTHNMLTSKCMKGVSVGYPLGIVIGHSGDLPQRLVEDYENNEDFLKKVHHVLLEVLGLALVTCLLLLQVVAADEEATKHVSSSEENESEEKKGSSTVTAPAKNDASSESSDDSSESEEKVKEASSTPASKSRRTTTSEEKESSESDEKEKQNVTPVTTARLGEAADNSDGVEDDGDYTKERTSFGK